MKHAKRTKVRTLWLIAVIAMIGFVLTGCTEPDGNNTTTPKHTHTWGEWSETTAATCMAQGEETRACGCGETETRATAIDPEAHDMQATANVIEAPTCTEPGLGEMACAHEGCGHTVHEGEIPPRGHDLVQIDDAVTTASTCTVKGIGIMECVREGCDHEEAGGELDLDGDNHTMGEYEQIVAPTCYAKGVDERRCLDCDSPDPVTIDGADMADHNMTGWHIITAATCIAEGLREDHCHEFEFCGHRIEDGRIIDIDTTYTGHLWQYDAASVEATCVVEGLGHRTCIRGGGCTIVEESANFGLNENNHKSLSANFIVTLYPTCTATGDSYKFCSDCEEYDEHNEGSYEEIPAFGGHSFPATTPATCTAANIRHPCNRTLQLVDQPNYTCGIANTGEPFVGALGHTGTIAAFAATCTTAGNSALSGNCVRFAQCGSVVTGTVLDALGHAFIGTTLVNNNITALTGIAVLTGGCSKQTEASCNPGTSTATLAEYIQAAAQTGTAADPVPLKVSIDLGTMGTDANGWTQLLAALNSGGKLVNLDLSDSTMTTAANAFITGNAWSRPAAVDGILQIASIVLPDTVTSIGNFAFFNCTNLTSVTIPDSVTTIGMMAFADCTNLTSITIPNSVTSIGNWAFQNCTGLTSVIIGNSVTSIGNATFLNCTNLTSVTIPNSVTSIGDNAFLDTGLVSVTFQRANTTIANDNSFPNGGSLRTAYADGGIGTYIRTGTIWAKQ